VTSRFRTLTLGLLAVIAGCLVFCVRVVLFGCEQGFFFRGGERKHLEDLGANSTLFKLIFRKSDVVGGGGGTPSIDLAKGGGFCEQVN